jgi:hypothetical protein
MEKRPRSQEVRIAEGQTKLRIAQEHVNRSRQMVEEQEARIAHAKASGADPKQMQEALATFRIILAHFEEDLKRLSPR